MSSFVRNVSIWVSPYLFAAGNGFPRTYETYCTTCYRLTAVCMSRYPSLNISPATLADIITMLVNDDCLRFLATLADDSVDLIVTDPPYYIGFDGGKGWDSQWKTDAEYLAWCDEWTRECVRVLKPNRMLVVWGTLKVESNLLYRLQTSKITGLVPQNEIIWSYNWGGRAKTNFARKHEIAWCWSKGKDFLFNADDVRVTRKVTKNIRTGEEYTKGTIPTCVWEQNNHTMSAEFCGWHPTTKNLDVLDRIIKAYSPVPTDEEDSTVLDIFSGSGSTAISALRNNRKFLGCELDPDYHTKSLTRIHDLTGVTVPTK